MINTIQSNWKLVSLTFVLGFILANILWVFGFQPNDISIFGFSYSLPSFDKSQTPQHPCSYYNFEVDEPIGGYHLENGQVRIDGSVAKLPSYGSVWLITIADTDPVTYWPQSVVTFDSAARKWNGVVYAASDVTAAIVIPDENGRILFDYFQKVVETAYQQNAQYPGLRQLSTDVQTCKTVTIRQP